jgi:transposase
MLKVEDRFMIKELHRAGVSISDIARLTGHDRKTVRAVIQGPLIRQRRPPPPRPGKLAPFKPYLEQRLGDGVFNAQKLFHEIQARGYAGRPGLVRNFVQPLRAARPSQATVRFETAPGEQAQVDWAHFGTIEHRGRAHPLYAFLFTLGWSRALYLEFTVAATTTAFLRGHLHAFRALGGCPRRILYDNLKSVVLDRDPGGAIHWNPTFLDFADYYGFAPAACRPYRAQTKGKVERGVGYVRGSFWPGLTVADLADLNRQARDWVEAVADRRVHGTTGEVPAERLPREGLQPLAGKPDYDTDPVCYRRSSRDSFISYGGVLYSAPLAHAAQQLLVRELEEAVIVVVSARGEAIARHALADGATRRVVDPAHFAAAPPRPSRTRPVARASGAPVRVAAPPGAAAWVLDAPLVEVRALADYDRLAEVRP